MHLHTALPQTVTRKSPYRITKHFSPTPSTRKNNTVRDHSFNQSPAHESLISKTKGPGSEGRSSNCSRYAVERENSITKEIVRREENKLVQRAYFEFDFSNLDYIDRMYWQVYQGESRGSGVRHGLGTQYFTNGQKWMGEWRNDKASGQGTYYRKTQAIMGVWQDNRIVQLIITMPLLG